jgi:hypothetical protein
MNSKSAIEKTLKEDLILKIFWQPKNLLDFAELY